MKEALIAFLAELLVNVGLKLFNHLKSNHAEGDSFGTTEERMREKLRKEGWI